MNSPERALSFLEFNLGAREGGKPVQFESLTLSNLYGFETGDGTLTCYLDVTEELQNRYGTLHGGCIATLVDIIGTAAQLTKYDRSGVSTNISVNYYRPAKGYRTVKIVGEVIKVGRSLHTIEVSVRDKETDQLLAKGIHIKTMTEAPTNLLAMAETFLERSSRAVREDGKPAIFDASALQGIYDIKARPGAITARMKVLEGHRNFMGNLHGGCTATLVDVVGSAALCTTTAKPHVSLSITTNYLRGAPLGSTIRVEAVVGTMAPSIDLTRAARFVNFTTKAKDKEGQPICFDAASLEGIYDVTAEEGAVTCYLRVGLRHRNLMGNLHGGCTAAMVDVIGSAALMTLVEVNHVSLSITTNYLRPAPVGSIVRIEAKVLKPGASVNTIEVFFYDDASGKLLLVEDDKFPGSVTLKQIPKL
ncbi:hypothetical protein QBZ16_000384 [Prototheca wickerhamii]|uniref:Thioesterase domain-containing protein n=1 Tax=Prototheca wickerhamii TaxID=3111 RepID=A0AAD9IMQ3_PROWI|nr:hypothetical protein QBZ16_000384 [Prototheca wickerhamii]